MKIIRTKAKNSIADDFAKTPSIEQEIEYRKLIAVEELLQFMKREGINRVELAERMGVPPSRITKMLSGDSNLTIDTLVRAGRAVGADLAQTFVPKGHRVSWLHYPKGRSGKRATSFSPAEDLKKVPQAQPPRLSGKRLAKEDVGDAA